jgi:uncharacterized protein (DUF362 family)
MTDMLGRRQFIGASIAAVALAGCSETPRWERRAARRVARSRVAVLAAPAYDDRLVDVVLQGLRLFRLAVADKTVVLKPNFVEFDPTGAINTHPIVVAATIEAFRREGARRVIVAEGPGHHRDTEYLLTASGLYPILRETRAHYVDLNNDDVQPLALGSHYTRLGRFYFPETVLKADLLVSMPKLKTHHWAGVTLSMKNMFGCIPGSIYGFPKNVLHWAGIPQSILDINSTLPVRRFAIVDGVVGMEGNGPIQGEPKPCGALIFGEDPVAVDATSARLMTINPRHVEHIAEAGRFLGNLAEDRIDQVGEPPDRLRQDFRVLPSFGRLKRFA